MGTVGGYPWVSTDPWIYTYRRDSVNTTKHQCKRRSLKQSRTITVPDEKQLEVHAQEIQIQSIQLMWNKSWIQLMSISLLIGCSDFVYLAGKRLAGCLSLGPAC